MGYDLLCLGLLAQGHLDLQPDLLDSSQMNLNLVLEMAVDLDQLSVVLEGDLCVLLASELVPDGVHLCLQLVLAVHHVLLVGEYLVLQVVNLLVQELYALLVLLLLVLVLESQSSQLPLERQVLLLYKLHDIDYLGRMVSGCFLIVDTQLPIELLLYSRRL